MAGEWKTRIMLVDDHPIFREGLKSLLDRQMDFQVVAECVDGRTAILKARELKPDVIIMDITLPDMNGIDSTRLIMKENPTIRVVALSIHSNRIFIQEMLDAGACGYVLKSCAFEDLIDAVRTVQQDQAYISPKAAKLLHHPKVERQAEQDTYSSSNLTIREREVLQLIAEGKSSKEIASELNIALKTVEKHRHCVKSKLNLHSTAELTKYAIQIALTPLEV